jgi:hypothetical protein
MKQYILYLVILIIGWFIGFTIRIKNKKYDPEKSYLSIRILLVLTVLVLLVLGIYALHLHDSSIQIGELIKIGTGGSVVIAILYSIMTYELNIKKNALDHRVRKGASTYSAASDWHKAPMIDYARISAKFLESPTYALLKTDIPNFFIEFAKDENIDQRKSLISILNYFETISVANNSEIMDDIFVQKYFKSIFYEYYDNYIVFINVRRKVKTKETIWIEFTNLVEQWKKQEN